MGKAAHFTLLRIVGSVRAGRHKGHARQNCALGHALDITYNKRISRIATIQEHKMILRAVERGVSEARIAAALNVNVALIRQKRTLLNGICPEAAELLRLQTH